MTMPVHQGVDYAARVEHYRQGMGLAEQTRVQHMAWAFEHLRAAEFWGNEHRHFALLIQLTLIQKWRANDAKRIQP
ncbi:hypothetical protein [Thiothrix sp.]|jgi:hypothetical protein|uniref:hypothetical protein n=1 Tax=Thiothrix sp. TaxID=1032 RepID=UPI00257B7C4B|nr:hypothetical protein [Thiothrix sp.]